MIMVNENLMQSSALFLKILKISETDITTFNKHYKWYSSEYKKITMMAVYVIDFEFFLRLGGYSQRIQYKIKCKDTI